jgi:NodT family efflux transporter outer membrane factor (OMF) lipoprotein
MNTMAHPRKHRDAIGKPVLALCLAVFLTGCTVVGPKYVQPTADLQPSWSEIETASLKSDPPVDPRWWKTSFNDPVLDGLVESAIAENLSVRSAGLRVLQARQQLAIAMGNRYPQTQQLTGEAQSNTTDIGTTEQYNLGFNVSWEVDFWGRFKLAVQSAAAQFDASVADYDSVMLTLLADVARSYLIIRTDQQRLQVAETNVELQEESLRITTAKFDAGATSGLDLEQATTLLYNTRASMSSVQQSMQQTKNSLAFLLGRPPQDLGDLLDESRPIPTVPLDIAIGMPQELIRRRPDIRTAERQLAAQSAQIGIAAAELFPQFTIGGNIGMSSQNGLSDLVNSNGFGLNFFGMFKWNIFNYGRIKSNVRFQDALFQQLLVDYRNTVLQAQVDVENAIVAYLRSQQQLAEYNAAAESAQRAVTVSTAQYEDGLVNFNTVITTLNSLRQQQDLLATTQGAVATNLVQVYKSLGGGWEVREGQAPDEMLPEATKDEMRDRTKAWEKVLK